MAGACPGCPNSSLLVTGFSGNQLPRFRRLRSLHLSVLTPASDFHRNIKCEGASPHGHW